MAGSNILEIAITAINKAGKVIKDVEKDLDGLDKGAKKASTGLLGMSKSALAAVGGTAALGAAVMTAAKFVQGSIDNWAAYNEEIRKMSIATGAAPEDISRMMQAADDLGVSIETLTTSFKFASRQGIQPTIANIARLSDELLAIKDPNERAAQAAKLFGRNWIEAAPFILAGGEAIKAGTAAINDNMAATDESIAASREYTISVDNLNDAWTGFSNTIAMAVMPALTDSLNVVNNSIPEYQNFLTTIMQLATGTYVQAKAMEWATKKVYDMKLEFKMTEGVAGAFSDTMGKVTTNTKNLDEATGLTAAALMTEYSAASQTAGAMNALKLATGETTLADIALQIKIDDLTKLMDDKLITPQQWATEFYRIASGAGTAKQKAEELDKFIRTIQDETINIRFVTSYSNLAPSGGPPSPGMVWNGHTWVMPWSPPVQAPPAATTTPPAGGYQAPPGSESVINNFAINLTGTGNAGADVASTVRILELLYG